MNVLVFLTDAFGGRGGIAQYNRDVLRALCVHPRADVVTVLPRIVGDDLGQLPTKLRFQTRAAGGKTHFLAESVRALGSPRPSFVLCAHINLLPIAAVAARRFGVPLALTIYGIEAWEPHRSVLVRRLLRRVDAVVSISALTRDRFVQWAGVSADRITIIPCCVDMEQFGVAPVSEPLVESLGVRGRKVLLTVARLAGEERYKGIDEVMHVLPELDTHIPVSYVIVGDGSDGARLASLAESLGVRERVVFAGHVPQDKKADYYRLADVFVMPGRREGFGIVYLEALACGIPVIASGRDGSREAVRDGALGQIVDPDDPQQLVEAILRATRSSRREVPAGLAYFGVDRFRERWHAFVDSVA